MSVSARAILPAMLARNGTDGAGMAEGKSKYIEDAARVIDAQSVAVDLLNKNDDESN